MAEEELTELRMTWGRCGPTRSGSTSGVQLHPATPTALRVPGPRTIRLTSIHRFHHELIGDSLPTSETIERVPSPVFNRYAARESGGIASEDEAHDGMTAPPARGNPPPDGSPPGLEEGEVAPLTNYAMPSSATDRDLACMAERRSARTGWPVSRRSQDASPTRLCALTAWCPLYSSSAGVVLSGGWIRGLGIQEDWSRVVMHLVLELPLTESSTGSFAGPELAEKIRLVWVRAARRIRDCEDIRGAIWKSATPSRVARHPEGDPDKSRRSCTGSPAPPR
jgi:hypothetical protein